MNNYTTISEYLIKKLAEVGVKDVFGIPGDYIINFFSCLEKSELNTIGTCSEQGAAFAADAYSRLNGIGAMAVTWCVGGFNTINAVAGAYAEKTPLIVISGAPGIGERNGDYLLHHSVQDVDSQFKIFKNVTVASTQLEDINTAIYEIDRVINACVKHKRPVYIELPRDIVNQKCLLPPKVEIQKEKSDKNALQEALDEACELLEKAENPVILGGIEIRRHQLKDNFLKLLKNTKYPYSTTFLGKAILDESHSQFLGVYMAKLGREKIRKYIEKSDCTLMIGTLMTDTNYTTAQLDPAKTIYATADQICIKHHYYNGVQLEDFIDGLAKRLKNDKEPVIFNEDNIKKFIPKKNAKLTPSRFYQRLDTFLKEKDVVVCDVGDCLFGTADTKIPKDSSYIGPVYYTSMGYAVPGAIGAQVANKDSRILVIVGDGAFQMTGHEISCFSKYGMNPIIFIINNKGYTTQRYLKDGSYNNIYNWEYHKWPKITNNGLGLEAHTEDELEIVLEKARNNTDSYTIVNLHLEPKEISNTLLRLTSHFCKQIKNGSDES